MTTPGAHAADSSGTESLSLASLIASGAGQGGCRQCGNCSSEKSSCHSSAKTQVASAVAHPPHEAVEGGASHAPQEVLSTLDRDGSRRWIMPRLATGRFWNRRRWVGYSLIAFFVTLPHLRVAGKPPLLLDIPARQLVVLGHTFLPTDTLLLALAMMGVFLSIMAVTTLAGRVWCGWACPQTVYMEFLFRPIDRVFNGTVGRGGKPGRSLSGVLAVARFAIYVVLAMVLAHTFLSYFVGTDRLAMWIRSSPQQHPLAFVVMIFTTVAILFDFLFFREQLCLIACPYGRFQSVMLDRRSLIVGYDEKRGEPRGRLQKSKPLADRAASPKGDCIDCKLCVAVCPTGIDIRNGLQMECINCTQCIDACDSVMDKIGRPRGLIRFSSQETLSGRPASKLRLRLLLYPSLLAIVTATFFGVLWNKSSFDATVLRGAGNPYTSIGVGRIQNSLKLRLVNRTDQPQTYQVEMVSPPDAVLEVMDPQKLVMAPGKSNLIPLSVAFPARLTGQGGRVIAVLSITDTAGQSRQVSCPLLGPKQ
ncbi:MAG: cytochrome c oxidase accessory protein CcoG [Planctomycetaceae bacterium]